MTRATSEGCYFSQTHEVKQPLPPKHSASTPRPANRRRRVIRRPVTVTVLALVALSVVAGLTLLVRGPRRFCLKIKFHQHPAAQVGGGVVDAFFALPEQAEISGQLERLTQGIVVDAQHPLLVLVQGAGAAELFL